MAGLLHPLPAPDPAEQLRIIAATPRWVAVHWSLLGAELAILIGYLGLAAALDGTGQQLVLRPAAGAIIFGATLHCFNILFMVGAGPPLAALAARGDAQGVAVFAALHPWGLAAQRLGGIALGVGLALFARGGGASGRLPRALGPLGILGGAWWVLAACAWGPESRAFFSGFAVAGAWQVVVGVLLLKGPTGPSAAAT